MGIIDKLPSSIQTTPPVSELHLDTVSFSFFSTAVNQATAMKRVCSVLQDTAGKLLDSFPAGWRKVCCTLGQSVLLIVARLDVQVCFLGIELYIHVCS